MQITFGGPVQQAPVRKDVMMAGRKAATPTKAPQFSGVDGPLKLFAGAAVVGMILKPIIVPINGTIGAVAKAKLNSGWKKLENASDSEKVAFLQTALHKADLHKSYGAQWAIGKLPEIKDDTQKTLFILQVMGRFHYDEDLIAQLEPAVNSVKGDYADALKSAYTSGSFQDRKALKKTVEASWLK